MAETIALRIIGSVKSSLRSREQAPRQGRDSATVAELHIHQDFAAGLHGLVPGRQIQVTCWMHLASRDVLLVHPKGDKGLPLTGVFATRSPSRPNPLAVYVLDLLAIEGPCLRVRGLDALDQTPVLDIRPHVRRLDD